ncbi:MAG TPA: hypothetical protein VFF06_24250 [Polyangia bacterium]|nr:hypothetical protein [Polyangia bacterium]
MRRLAALLICAAGCGPSSFDDFRDQLVSRSCDRAIRCGALGASERNACPSPPELAVIAPGALDVGAEVDANRMRFAAGGAQQCLDAIAGAPCAAGALEWRLNLRCHHVYAPKVAAGGECHGDGECEGGFCAGATCPGRCVAWPAVGDPCTPPNGCDPTVEYCGLAGPGASFTCLVHKQEGDACADGSECAFGLLCIAAKCSTPPRGGQPGDVCDDFTAPCDESLFCDGATHHCAAHAQLGATCEQPEACADGLACAGLGPAGSSGTCRAWLDVGQACTPGAGLSGCPASQFCDPATSRCALRGPAVVGERQACAGMTCADGFYCDALGLCSFPTAIGGKCMDSSSCAPGLACDPMLLVCTGPNGVCAP